MSRPLPRWPLYLIASPAAVAVWSGWIGLGTLCRFGMVHPLPGIADGFQINTAITLPVGVEAYGACALRAWLTPDTSETARKFARCSAIGSLALGMCGQVIYYLLSAAHATRTPWPIIALISCLPVVTLGFGPHSRTCCAKVRPMTWPTPRLPPYPKLRQGQWQHRARPGL